MGTGSETRRRGGTDGQSTLWQGRTDTNRRVVMPGLPVGLRQIVLVWRVCE